MTRGYELQPPQRFQQFSIGIMYLLFTEAVRLTGFYHNLKDKQHHKFTHKLPKKLFL